MTRQWVLGLLSIIIALLGTAFTRDTSTALSTGLQPVSAPNPPPGPDRFTVIVVEYTAFEWKVAAWRDQKKVCTVIVDHEGQPLPGEIFRDCGETIYDTWINQPPCLTNKQATCKGYYTVLVDSSPAEKEIAMQLAPASVWISLEDCEAVLSTSTNICETTPTLVITGQEPLPNEMIIRVEGTYNGESFDCDETDICKFHIGETGNEGVTVEFWSYSSYGDSSLIYTAQVRVQKVDEGDPDQYYWYVDVLSPQWQGQAVATCADSWNVFPPVGGPPEWLTTPKQSEDLSSDIPYTYLAANLILQGAVDASSCVDGGLDASNGVNQCGLEQSRPAVNEWQNQFDELILGTAQETGVPARLLKNLFARESQFWPGIYQAEGDVGLGQLTENGADTTLFWNHSFYNQFCPLILEDGACGAGYMHLDDEQQALLRRALVGSVNATCDECPLGLDLTQADFSVGVFAHTMIANCEQAGQVIRNYTDESPGKVASYEDLWKFTLVNYNAGGGCLAEAITHAQGLSLELNWENVSPLLTGACSGAIDYVNDISQ
ncbi:MAG: hypothetical protein H7Y59_02295 [Anaerolineales bacterium]|nr:hypothetical protein [Anaerolineales bacterium]